MRLTTVVFFVALPRTLGAQAAPADHATHHRFVLPSFTFEDGTTLPHTVVSYGTYGRLNARKDNVILLPSSYMADHHDNDWLIGPGLALDTTRYFLVATRALRQRPLLLSQQHA